MKGDEWQKVKELFYQARKLKPEEREAFLVEICEGNDEIRQQVSILLESYKSDFMEETAVHQIKEIISVNLIQVGQRFGHYEIKEILGVGGMGEVFLAEDFELKRLVAIKILLTEAAEDKERVNRFIQEARAASALNHPSILTIYEVGSIDGTRFIASEYVKGVTLREKLKSRNLDITTSLEIAEQIAAALRAAHEAGIVHRDIKPDNIIIRHDSLVKVLDFGLAKLAESKTERSDFKASTLAQVKTNPGVVMGTVAYMSPEQARGQAVDARTDIWSLGIVLYEMLSGKLPFPGETTSDIIAAILKSEVEPLENLNNEIPRELKSICLKALAKDTNERYQTAQSFGRDLRQVKKYLERAREQPRLKDSNYFAARNTDLIPKHPTMSKEYLFTQIKEHKVGSSILFVILLFTIIFGVSAYLLPSNREQTKSAHTAPLVAWYKADGDAADSVSGNDGAILNVIFAPGYSGEAFRFGSGYLEIPHSPSLDLQRLSISVWARSLTPRSPGLYNYLFSMGSSNCNGYGAFQLQTDNTGGLRFGIGTFGGAQSPDAGREIWDGNWHYVVGTYDGSVVRLFVDGSEIGSGTPLPNHKITYNELATNNLIVGDIQTPCFWGDSYKFHGDLDDIKIYNRALSKEEVKGIYTAASRPPL